MTKKFRLTLEGAVYDIIVEDLGEVEPEPEPEEERKLLPKPEKAADEERQ